MIPPYPCKIFETRKDSKPQSKKIHTEILTFSGKKFTNSKKEAEMKKSKDKTAIADGEYGVAASVLLIVVVVVISR